MLFLKIKDYECFRHNMGKLASFHGCQARVKSVRFDLDRFAILSGLKEAAMGAGDKFCPILGRPFFVSSFAVLANYALIGWQSRR